MDEQVAPGNKHKKGVYKRWKLDQCEPGEIQGHSKLAGTGIEKPKRPRAVSDKVTWKVKRAST